MIELKNLNKIYEGHGASRTHAVRGVSLQLPERGIVAIFGRSGCGKTTLLNCIGGLDRASGGSVLLDGAPVTPVATDLRNRRIGYIFQNYNLAKTLTVFENVALSLRLCGVRDEAEIERRVLAALECVDMEKYRKRMPDALSGGQQQRVAIARALVKNPDLILADEPTGNLDEQNTVMVMDLLKEIAKEKLVLLVTHEASLVDLYCDRVIEMEDGSVLQQRENAVTEGYHGKADGEIWLGDLPMQSQTLGESRVEYYGEPADLPPRIRFVSVNGTLYVQADTPLKLRFVDESSEAHLHEGKYTERKKRTVREISPALREPLVATDRCGVFYRLKNAIKSGFRANFTKTRRGKKLLIAALVCFPLVITMVLALFGPGFYELQRVEQAYNPNTVFLRTDAVSREQLDEYRAQRLIDHVSITRYAAGTIYPHALSNYFFSIGNFETFLNEESNFFYAEGVLLPNLLLSEASKMLCGTYVVGEGQIVISRGFADELLENVGVDFIRDYDDLLYIEGRCNTWQAGVPTQSVVGITDEAESVVYLDPYTYAQVVFQQLYSVEHGYFSDVAHSGFDGLALSPGEIALVRNVNDKFNNSSESLKEGSRIELAGLPFTVAEVISLQMVDEEAFSLWILSQHGSNIYEDLAAFSLWHWGYDATNAEEWEKYGKEVGETHAQVLQRLEKEFASCYEGDAQRFLELSGVKLPTVIMTCEDMLKLCSRRPTGKEGDLFYEMYTDWVEYENPYYALHTEDVAGLVAQLSADFEASQFTTPAQMREHVRSYLIEELLFSSVAILLVSLLMSLCLYFIMRASLMGEIREIGILRAIGVSRRNLVFRYLIETLVLFVLTVLIGFLFSSAVLLGISSIHPAMASILYYPWWMALAAFVWLVGVSVLCGLLPICSLLRRTPAAILSKYDI